MAKTVANQNLVIIKKTPCKTNFLQVNNDEWMTAAKILGKSFNAFKIYLYLASNEVNYEKALSYADISNKLEMKSTSYYDSLALLKRMGYVKDLGGNKLEFYTSPQAKDDNVKLEEQSVSADIKSSQNNKSATADIFPSDFIF